jgi:hypothetical protein
MHMIRIGLLLQLLLGGAPTPISTDDSVPIDAFKTASYANRASDSPVTLDDVNSGRYAAWFRKAFNLGPNDVVILGLGVDFGPGIDTASMISKWEHDQDLLLVGNARYEGFVNLQNNPFMLDYFNTHPLLGMAINNAAASGDFSLLDGAVLEVLFPS